MRENKGKKGEIEISLFTDDGEAGKVVLTAVLDSQSEFGEEGEEEKRSKVNKVERQVVQRM